MNLKNHSQSQYYLFAFYVNCSLTGNFCIASVKSSGNWTDFLHKKLEKGLLFIHLNGIFRLQPAIPTCVNSQNTSNIYLFLIENYDGMKNFRIKHALFYEFSRIAIFNQTKVDEECS